MIAKYIVLSNMISVVPDNILRICVQEPLLILKKNSQFFFLVTMVRYLEYQFIDIKKVNNVRAISYFKSQPKKISLPMQLVFFI